MSTVELKNKVHSLIDAINDSATLQAIITLLNKSEAVENDWWDELSDSDKESIDKGIKDIEEGKFSSHDEVMGRMKKKYPKHF